MRKHLGSFGYLDERALMNRYAVDDALLSCVFACLCHYDETEWNTNWSAGQLWRN